MARSASRGHEAHAAQLDAVFQAFCREHGLLVTDQRRAIFAELAASQEHPSAEEIHHAVLKRLPNISLATVYKNLDALQLAGAISDLNTLHDKARYEATLQGTSGRHPHHHLVCVCCKRVANVFDDALDAVRIPRSKLHGFALRNVRVQAEGLCPDCRRDSNR